MQATNDPRSMNQFAGLLQNPGRIAPEDIRYFREEVFRDGVVSRQEAEAVLALNSAIAEKCPEWDAYFVEAVSDFVVASTEPRGHVSHANAEWLIECLTRDGRIEPANELELAIKIMERAESSPDLLAGFALNIVAKAVIDGSGPLAGGHSLEPGVISEGETELIRRVLYAHGGHSGIAISRTEAEILFDLNDRTHEADNHPAWRELFVKAIANYLMAAATERAPSRLEAITPEAWLEQPETGVAETVIGAFRGFGDMLSKSFFESAFDSSHEQMEKAWAERNARLQASMTEAGQISDAEADWLIEKLGADGIIHDNEKSLLAFIRTNSSALPAPVESMIEKHFVNA